MNKIVLLLSASLLFLVACGSNNQANVPGNTPDTKAIYNPAKDAFQNNCLQCHGLKQDKTGPMLAGVFARWNNDTAKLVAFVKNSQQLIEKEGADSYAHKLYEKWYKVNMPAFAGLSDADIKEILDYVNKGEE